MSGLLSPLARQNAFVLGQSAPGALLYTYAAGGVTTPQPTFSNVALTVANANPVVASAAGLFGPLFLSPGISYRFDLYTADSVLIYSQDNIATIVTAGVQFTGTAGEDIAAGLVAYQNYDGSGGKTIGLWYRADATNAYSSTLPLVAMVQAAVLSGNTVSLSTAGLSDGHSGLVSGTPYYLSTLGTLTGTPPANARLVGQAVSTTALVLQIALYGPVIEFGGAVRVDGALDVTGVTGLAGYKETSTAIAIASNVLTVNLALGSYFSFSNTANINTTTVSNIPASGRFGSFVLEVTANGSGFTWAWLTSTVVWPGGIAPTVTQTNGKVDRFLFMTRDGGTHWAGAIIGQNYSA